MTRKSMTYGEAINDPRTGMTNSSLFTTENFERTVRAAEAIGAALQYSADGSLILVAEGEVGRDIYAIVKNAVELAQKANR